MKLHHTVLAAFLAVAALPLHALPASLDGYSPTAPPQVHPASQEARQVVEIFFQARQRKYQIESWYFNNPAGGSTAATEMRALLARFAQFAAEVGQMKGEFADIVRYFRQESRLTPRWKQISQAEFSLLVPYESLHNPFYHKPVPTYEYTVVRDELMSRMQHFLNFLQGKVSSPLGRSQYRDPIWFSDNYD